MRMTILIALLSLISHQSFAYQPDMATEFGQRVEIASPPVDPVGLPIQMGDGSETFLTGREGRVTVVVFWATWCHVCLGEMPVVDAVAEEMKGEGIDFFAVSLDSGDTAVSKVERYFEDHLLENLDVAIDVGRLNFANLGGRGTPTSYVIGKDGKLVARIQGPGLWESEEAKRMLRDFAGR